VLHTQSEQAPSTARVGLTLLLVAGGALALLALAALPSLYQFWRASDYPGAARISNHSNLNVADLYYRHDASFRTKDEFPIVYNWYSSGQGLGPEQRAQSNCILMARTLSQLYVIERYTGVMLCDTPTGRLIYVTRSVTVRRP